MTGDDRELVDVWRKSTGEKLGVKLTRRAARLNPDLALTPTQRSKDKRKTEEKTP